MTVYKISAGTDVPLTYFDKHCTGEGSVELSLEEVDALKEYIDETLSETLNECEIDDLVRDADKGDRERMKILQGKLRPIYQKLDGVCRQMVADAKELEMLKDGVEDGSYVYDVCEVICYCEKKGVYKFEYAKEDYLDQDGEVDEDRLDVDKCENFQKWLPAYVNSLSDADAREFIINELHGSADISVFESDYDVKIPQEIVDMAWKN